MRWAVMNLKSIKSVVFDFDETLYSGGDWSGYGKYVYEMFVELNMFGSVAEAERALSEKYPTESDAGIKVLRYLLDNNLPTNLISEYNSSHFYDVGLDRVQRINVELLSKLSRQFDLYIVTNSSMQYLTKSLKKLGISKGLFRAILGNEFDQNDTTKAVCLKRVLEISKQKPEEILMVGDDEYLDIEPAKKLGFQTFLVKNVKDTEKIIGKLLQIKQA